MFHYANKGCQNKQLEWAKKGQKMQNREMCGHATKDWLTDSIVSFGITYKKGNTIFWVCFYLTENFLREFHFMVIYTKCNILQSIQDLGPEWIWLNIKKLQKKDFQVA